MNSVPRVPRPFDRELEALAARQHGLLTREQAREVGASPKAIRHRLEANRWEEVAAGVYRLLGAPTTPRQRLLAAILACGPRAVASHRSAAWLLGIPGFGSDTVELTVPGLMVPRRAHAFRLHRTSRLPPAHVRAIDEIPCTSAARTLFDNCGCVHPQRAERALDNALARRIVTVAALWRVLDDLSAPGRAGSALMRRLLEERGGRYVAPESELEARLLELVQRHRLPTPERQVDLGDTDGWIGRVDFLFRPNVVVEVDGRLGHTSLLDRQSDDERDRRLRASGRTVVRLGWDDVTLHDRSAAEAIRRALAAAA